MQESGGGSRREAQERIARGEPNEVQKPIDTTIGNGISIGSCIGNYLPVTIGTGSIPISYTTAPYYYPSYYTGVVPGVTLTTPYNPAQPVIVSFVVSDATAPATDELIVRIMYNGKNYVGTVRVEVITQSVQSIQSVQEQSTPMVQDSPKTN
jgi:hypothetical protein